MKRIAKQVFERSVAITSLTVVILLVGIPRVLGQTLPVCPTSLIANPFYHYRGATVAGAVLDNRVAALFSRVPNGTRLYKFDSATERFTENVFRMNRWTKPNETLSPGEGAIIFNPKAQSFDVIIPGNCNLGSLELPQGLSLISSPGCGTINFAPLAPPPVPPSWYWDSLAFNPQEGDKVYTFSNSAQSFQIHHFHNGAWDSQPSVGIGESCFVHTLVSRQITFKGPLP